MIEEKVERKSRRDDKVKKKDKVCFFAIKENVSLITWHLELDEGSTRIK